ncbi:MAG: MFS transporter [Rubrivivax sp.]
MEPRRAWVVVWACFAALAVIFGVSYSFAAFFESLAGEFQASRAQVSLVFGFSGLLYFVLGAFAGMLADRFGPLRVTSAGMLCIAGALLLGSAARSLVQVTLAWGVGLGVGVAPPTAPAIGCVQPWFTRRRGLLLVLASAGIGAGTLVGPLAAAAAIATWQWRGAMAAMAAAVVLVGLTSTPQLRRAPRPPPGGRAGARHAALERARCSRRFRGSTSCACSARPPCSCPSRTSRLRHATSASRRRRRSASWASSASAASPGAW